MTDITEEIRDLIVASDQAIARADEARRALEKAVREAREKHNPQTGEAWRVLPLWDSDVRGVIPAIKTVTGWVTDPAYFGEYDIDEGYRTESAVIPLERVAEAPAIDQRED
ncbi:hypothetical protein [Corynebacterium urealyticum]|uniref:hypothetical protein n=1 Tax=Corynebacterium urealyticum TaxID=43771 RepID=UPI0011E78D04|nr:hypothetical protein [Corynebacterium urealyticum]TYR15611.1 hypothetical protein FYJ89_03530 [Corynebacterium urealyticum]TYR17947.1 hypothetical protein FYJ88_03730 [Corynebacterium urealyticum]